MLEELQEKKVGRRELLKVAGAGLAGVALAQVVRPTKALAQSGTKAGGGPRFAMLIDIRRCIGCQGCSVACKSEFSTPLGVFRSHVMQQDKGKFPAVRRQFLPWLCNHCEEAPCVAVCPVEKIKAQFKRADGVTVEFEKAATYQRPDGVVLVDNERCIGCYKCVTSCPYRARFADPVRKAGANGSKQAVGKCTYCEHRVAEGIVPSCVNTCTGRARIFGDINDRRSEISKALKANKSRVKTLMPELGTKPHTFYIGLEDDIYLDAPDIRDQEKGEDFREDL